MQPADAYMQTKLCLTNDGSNGEPFVTRASNKFLFCIMVQIVHALETRLTLSPKQLLSYK